MQLLEIKIPEIVTIETKNGQTEPNETKIEFFYQSIQIFKITA
jgi:hypothetical protein